MKSNLKQETYTDSTTRFWGEGSETIKQWAGLGINYFFSACFWGFYSKEISEDSIKELDDLSGCFWHESYLGVKKNYNVSEENDSSNTYHDEYVEISMKTMRNIPFGLFDRIAILFPRIHAEGYYLNEYGWFLGTYVIDNGHFLWVQIDWPSFRFKGDCYIDLDGYDPLSRDMLKVLEFERDKLKGNSAHYLEFKELLDEFNNYYHFFFTKIERGALLGDNESQFNLYKDILSGNYYRSKTIYGTEVDFSKSHFFNTPNMMEESWLKIAAYNDNFDAFEILKNHFVNKAESGNSMAMLSLSYLYQGKDDGKVRYWLDKAVETEDLAAKKVYGDYLCLGMNGYVKNSKLAVKLWNEYCFNQTIIDPQYYFYCALSYHTGYGVSKDEDKYKEMVEQLSLPDYSAFFLFFAKAFLDESEIDIVNEIGIELDPVMAYYWLEKGCEVNNKACMLFLAKECLKGERIKKDYSLAFKLLNTLWQSNNPNQKDFFYFNHCSEICFYIGMCYENGFGVEMDKYRAYSCYCMVGENDTYYEQAQIKMNMLKKEKYEHDLDSKYNYALSIINGCRKMGTWFERETKISIRLLLEIIPWRDSVKDLNLIFAELLNLPENMDTWTDDTLKETIVFLNEFSEFEIIKEKRDCIVNNYYNYACSKAEIGHFDDALAIFKRISIYKDCSEAIRNIKERRIKKAILLYSKNEDEKANAVINQILSWEYYPQEQKDRCLQLIEESKEEAKELFLESKRDESVRLFAKILLI